MKKEQIKELFLYYDESYAETHFLLKNNNLKSLKQFFDNDIFKSHIEKEETKTIEKESMPLTPPKETKLDLPITPLTEGIITKLSKNFLLCLFDFFDPMTLTNISMTCKYLQEVSNHNPLYKKFCLILFSNKNLLPQNTPLVLLQEYINKYPLEFDEIVRNKANFDIRSLVWGSANYLDEFRTGTSFYKQFENWKNCFGQAPRVCLKGYYILKEKYLKIGEMDINHTYDPIHVVEYFRYIRFFENGLAIMCISSYKLSQEKIIKLFNKAMAPIENQNNLMENALNLFLVSKPKNEMKQTILKGEYMRKDAKIYAKFCSKSSSLSEYELLIKSSQSGKNDLLFVLKRINKELINNYIRDDNDQRATGMKVFEFKKVSEFALDIKDMGLRSVTL